MPNIFNSCFIFNYFQGKTLSIMCTLSSFAIDPHGARVDHYDRGYSSGGGSGAGFLIVLFIVVGAIILFASSSNTKKKETKSSSSLNYNPYHDLEERIRRQQKEDEDFKKGCSWAFWIIGIWFTIFMANYFFNFIK